MSSMDYNVDNYTVTELLTILGLNDFNVDEIKKTTAALINRFSSKDNNQPNMVIFFTKIQTKLISYINENDKQTPLTKETTQPTKEIKQPTEPYDTRNLINREKTNTNNNFIVPVSQDKLNPNLENTTNRFINLDSQFRQASGGTETISTDYTLDLSDPLTNVLNLRLYSVQIPYTWYAIDYIYGNTCFWVTNKGNVFKIFIEPGNYSPTELCIAIQLAFTSQDNFKSLYQTAFTPTITPIPQIAIYNTNNGKISLKLNGWIDPANNIITAIHQMQDTFNIDINPYYTFFDFTGLKNSYDTGSQPSGNNTSKGQTFDGTLGWIMGFRLPMEPIYSVVNMATSVVNLYGPKYFILVLDDFNQNHINNGLITITEISKTLAMPSYYNYSQPQNCPIIPNIDTQITNITGQLAGINSQTAISLGINPDVIMNSLQDKLNYGFTSFPQVLPSFPRTLTQAQIYTVNEILKNRSKTTSFRSKAPTNSDTFALIPIKYGSMTTGDIYVEFSGSMQDNKRIYFGPVNIDRMRVTLVDDRGNVVDLHGGEWSFTIISENLYQY